MRRFDIKAIGAMLLWVGAMFVVAVLADRLFEGLCPDPSLHEPGLVVCPHYTPEQMDAEPLVPTHREVKGKVL